MQVAILTGSRSAETKMLTALNILGEANVSIEARILDEDCATPQLKNIVEDLFGDVILVGSTRAQILGSLVSKFASGRLVVGVPLTGVEDYLDLYQHSGILNNENLITVPINDVERAASLALEALENIKAKEAST